MIKVCNFFLKKHRAPLLSLLCILSLSSCSIGYLSRAAFEESKILLNRREIAEVIADPETTLNEREKLSYVLQAREFTLSMGLTPKNSFTKYTKITQDVLTWVVVGSRPDAFEFATWWFPFAGTLPYKGFFEKKDAEELAAELESEGYESWVRGAEAFSTLGWFNDPVLTPALKNHESRVVNTVVHETVHATFWIKNNVQFNESLANFVGLQGAIEFFTYKNSLCAAVDNDCLQKTSTQIQYATQSKQTELDIAQVLETLYQDLDALYSSDKPRAEKLELRQQIFESQVTPLRQRYPRMTMLKKINNAEIIQFILYMKQLRDFESLFKRQNSSWPDFFAQIRAIQDQVEKDGADPFKVLSGMV